MPVGDNGLCYCETCNQQYETRIPEHRVEDRKKTSGSNSLTIILLAVFGLIVFLVVFVGMLSNGSFGGIERSAAQVGGVGFLILSLVIALLLIALVVFWVLFPVIIHFDLKRIEKILDERLPRA
jgi:uncharacterized BrkB/YihY/UPF0761 family membrane protein